MTSITKISSLGATVLWPAGVSIRILGAKGDRTMTSLTNQAVETTRSKLVTRLNTGLALEAFLLVNITSYFLAFLLRCQFSIPANVMTWFWATLPVILGLKTMVLVLAFNRANAAIKLDISANQIIFAAASLSAIGIYALNLSLFEMFLYPIPRSVIAIDWGLSLVLWFRLQAVAKRFADGTALRTEERTAKTCNKEIPTISMGSGGPKVNS